MHRFFIVTGCALRLVLPTHAAPKPKPPAISVCGGNLCLDKIRWKRPDPYTSLSSIEGYLVNNSAVSVSNVALGFALFSGNVLKGTATDSYAGEITPGGRWFFQARFLAFDGRIFITRSESVSMSSLIRSNGTLRQYSQTLQFDPVFDPDDRRERKQWEKIHGKRQR